MNTYTTVKFDHPIRRTWVHVEAEANGDESGFFNTAILGVYLDGAEVSDLLTEDDLTDIDAAIIPAIHAQISDDNTTKGY